MAYPTRTLFHLSSARPLMSKACFNPYPVYTGKKVSGFPVPIRDVTYQARLGTGKSLTFFYSVCMKYLYSSLTFVMSNAKQMFSLIFNYLSFLPTVISFFIFSQLSISALSIENSASYLLLQSKYYRYVLR